MEDGGKGELAVWFEERHGDGNLPKRRCFGPRGSGNEDGSQCIHQSELHVMRVVLSAMLLYGLYTIF